MNKSNLTNKLLAGVLAIALAFGFSGVAQAQLNPVTGTCLDDGLILGTALSDSINSLGGVLFEVILDFGGNDIINGHGTPPFVAPCAPNLFELIVDLAGNDRITGTPGVLDVIVDLAGFNKINTGGGVIDLVLTGAGNDEVAGASAPGVASAVDIFIDLGGANQLNGNGGLIDFMVGGPGVDTLTSSASLFNIAVADFTFTAANNNTLRSKTSTAFGFPGIGILIGSLGADAIFGGNQATDFIAGLPAPGTAYNNLQGGDEYFNTAPFPGDFIIGGGAVTRDQILPGKGFDISFGLSGNDTFTLRPGDSIAGVFEPVVCGVGTDTVLLKGFNSRTTAITTLIPGVLVTVTDVNSGAFSGYALFFCETIRFTR